MNPLLSDNINAIAGAIKKAIEADGKNEQKERAREGVNYYNFKHDILDNKIYFINDDGNMVEDQYASNSKIPHAFLNELIDQKTQYLLSNPIEVTVDGDDELQKQLNEYYDEDFQLFVQELVEGGSQKGFEYAYMRTNNQDRLTFQVADALKVIPIYDDSNELKRIMRHYVKTITKGNKTIKIHHAEVYDESKVFYFVSENNGEFVPDTAQAINPAPHVRAVNKEGQLAGRSYGTLPFYRYKNNQAERTDLEPIKAIIDDYDLMNAFLSNNLQDFAEAIYVVKGFEGDSLDKLRQNIRTKKTVGVGSDGALDVKEINIPVEARKTKLELDRENIYKFGFGFDSSQVGDGNVTNVVIKGRYTLLNMKANKTEVRLRAFLKWANQMIINDINRRTGRAYDPSLVSFTITREMLVNENDIIANEKAEAETRSVEMQTLLAVAPKLPDETVLRKICEAYELDFEEVQALLETQDYNEPSVDVTKDTDPVDQSADDIETAE
jgi:SPP1 family phage portal protein